MMSPGEAMGGLFPIGFDSLPVRDMPAAARRGGNLLVRWDNEGGTVSPAAWSKAARDNGFKTIRPPVDPAADLADSTLIAVNLPDEPDLSSHWYGERPAAGWPAGIKVWNTVTLPGGRIMDLVGKEQGAVKTGITSAAGAVAVYNFQAENIKANWPHPIFGNFAGNAVTFGMDENNYRGFMKAPDWGGSDWYPIANDPVPPPPLPAGVTRRYGYDFPLRSLNRLQAWGDGKPQFAYIEAANLMLGNVAKERWRWPTMDEIAAQVWGCIAGGAAGIIYFIRSISVGRSDAITSTINRDYTSPTPDVLAAQAVGAGLTVLNGQIQKLAPFLNRPQDRAALPIPGTKIVGAKWAYTGNDPNFAGCTLEIYVNLDTVSAGLPNGLALAPLAVWMKVTQPAAPVPAPDPAPNWETRFAAMAGRLDAMGQRLDGFQKTLDALKNLP